MKQGAMRTVLSGFLAAFAWPATLLAATDFIDSKWSVAIDRYLQTPVVLIVCNAHRFSSSTAYFLLFLENVYSNSGRL
jgi:hypothetical protein